jgi:CelD/BcsL family acetyltransferase involved in cellulose biosynthesis
VTVEVVHGWPEEPAFWRAWDHLLDDCGRTLCLTPEWLLAWREGLGSSWTPMFVLVRAASGGLRAAAPLAWRMERPRLGRPLCVMRLLSDGTGVSDDLRLLLPAADANGYLRTLLTAVDRSEVPWDILRLETLGACQPATASLATALEERGWLHERLHVPGMSLRLIGGWNAYLDGLSRSARTSLLYKRRRLEARMHARTIRVEHASQLDWGLGVLIDLHRQRWGGPGNFAPDAVRFYRVLARRLLSAGLLDLFVLEAEGHPAAAHLGARCGRTHVLLESGFNPGLEGLSPGMVLLGNVLQVLASEGVECVDFHEGTEEYKRRVGAVEAGYVGFACARPGTRGARALRWAAFQRRLRGRLTAAGRRMSRAWFAAW